MAFSFWKALGHGVTRVRERPLDAARIWAFDALLLAVVPGFLIIVSGAWSGPGEPVAFASLSPLQTAVLIASLWSLPVFWLASEGAWARFLATGEPATAIPYRLGRDELRIFGVIALWAVVGFLLLLCLILPIGLVGVLAEQGGPGGRAGAALLVGAAIGISMFIMPRIHTSMMLAVRRKAFSPLGHFSASDPFWFRLGLAFGVAYILSLVSGYILPGLAALAAGYTADVAGMISRGSLIPWSNWAASKPSIGFGEVLVLLVAWIGGSFGLLLTRGVFAHAALHALEQHELDARGSYPAGAST